MRRPAEDDEHAPLLLAQVEYLQAYADQHGREWKQKLWLEWTNATADPVLSLLRNSHGPSWLLRYNLRRVEDEK
ncbi:hypothetical protein HN018_24255 (plasmid) [Lichenicola cladoniae]|uniref:Uncharacterized protein n=1 Tax=Lichenicola cladoniae TaxID=1484109 RepID=A0A6M8HYV2_9PROT|nr:hypothetical protein [Lichenicola cladoniae]NPD70275.1 hypothetical protein [Acetobacteraceae bacterium]QKE93325.1 hypothetical protein HN018_24255 [Lichenicola cladoniae]